jgi:DNA integrity scanning protein DisA with diadenylate cyclase activity
MRRRGSCGKTMQFFKKKGDYILLALLLTILFVFDEKSAIDFLKIFIVFVISSMIIKNYFSSLLDNLIKNGEKSIYEYVFSAIFTAFIFIEIEFLLNKIYSYAFCVFLCLLIFTGVSFYFAAKIE